MPKVTVVTLPKAATGIPKQRQAETRNTEPERKYLKPVLTYSRSLLQILFFYNHVALNVLAFLVGRVTVMGEMSPFGIAFFTASSQVFPRYAPAAGMFALGGMLSGGRYTEAGVGVFSILLYRRLATSVQRKYPGVLGQAGLMTAAMLSGWLTVLAVHWQQSVLYDLLAVGFDAGITFFAAVIFFCAMPLLFSDQQQTFRPVHTASFTCLIITLAVAISGLGDSLAAGLSLRNIAGGVLIMTLALLGGSGMGATGGVAIGLALSLAERGPLPVALYTLAGVSGGLFRPFGKAAAGAGAMLGAAIIAVYFGQALQAILVEFTVAAGLFLLIPRRFLNLWQEILCTAPPDTGREQLQQSVAKLNGVAAMFGELAAVFGKTAAGATAKIQDDELSKALSTVGDQVCGDCDKRQQCWGEPNFYRTSQVIWELLNSAEKHKITAAHLPAYWRENCNRHSELTGVINLTVDRNRDSHYWLKKITEQRQMLTEQIKSTAAVLGQLVEELTREPCDTSELAARLKNKAGALDCHIGNVKISGPERTAPIHIDKWPCQNTKECRYTLLPLAASLLGEKLTLQAKCGSAVRQKKCRLVLQAAKRFHVETGIAQQAKEVHGVCGDTCSAITLQTGKVALVLSDGMGSGSQAFAESSTAVRFMERMLAADFSLEAAVKTLNALLMLKTPDENFATLDMTIIDVYSGQTQLIKIGASPTFVKRVREVGAVKQSSVPMGILRHVAIEPVNLQLAKGDIVVLVSDGVIDAPRGSDKELWLINFLRRLPDLPPQAIADKVLQEAKRLSGETIRDDMTILVAKLVEITDQ